MSESSAILSSNGIRQWWDDKPESDNREDIDCYELITRQVHLRKFLGIAERKIFIGTPQEILTYSITPPMDGLT